MRGAERDLSAPWRWLWDHPTVVVTFALLVVLWWVDYSGRLSQVDASRAECDRAAVREAASVNDLRADVVLLVVQRRSDARIAAASGVPAGARRARRVVAAAESEAVARKLAEITTADAVIDRGAWWRLVDAWDQRVVRDGRVTARGRVGPFRCVRAYPAPAPIMF